MSAEQGDGDRDGSKGSPVSDLDSGTGSQSVVLISKEELDAALNTADDTTTGIEEEVASDMPTEDEIDRYIYSDDFESDGELSDIEDNVDNTNVPPKRKVQYAPDMMIPGLRPRELNPDLPSTVTKLETSWGSRVYLVGTAHFSEESQNDVSKTIQATQPDVVLVELCNSRLNILQLDEQKLLEEAQNINLEKIRTAVKQSGLSQGIMHLLFLSFTAHLTKELGMAPGGEFRRAFAEAKKIQGCRLVLGDRPIQITLQRALSSLSVWQKIRLAWYLITSKDPISKEEVEKCKQKDLLEEMLKEMTGEFPGLSRVFIDERDAFLAHTLKHASQPVPHPAIQNQFIPTVSVGVVGMGHVPGILQNWESLQCDIREIMEVPPPSLVSKVFRFGFRMSLLGILTFACWRLYRWVTPVIT